MPATYEFWLLDDAGSRICLLENYAYFSYSRSIIGYGTILIGLPYDDLVEKISPIFAPDRRIDVWRSPAEDLPMRREAIYILRMHKIYTRETDNLRIVAFTGRDPTDLLSRRFVIQPGGSPPTRKTAPIDDMMKAVVREQMLYGSCLDETGVLDNTRGFPQGEFRVAEDLSLGPDFDDAFADERVSDIVRDLRQASFNLNALDPTDRRIYFDVVPYDIPFTDLYICILDEATGVCMEDEIGRDILDERSAATTSGLGFKFVTLADRYGNDRRGGIEFSMENGNLEAPYYLENHLDEVNSVIAKGFGRGDSRIVTTVDDDARVASSRWNRGEAMADASQEPDLSKLAGAALPVLYDGRPKQEISAVLLNVPEGRENPQCLYGLDWDLGDLVRVSYARRHFDVEVSIIYVAIDERGRETITGRNQVSAES